MEEGSHEHLIAMPMDGSGRGRDSPLVTSLDTNLLISIPCHYLNYLSEKCLRKETYGSCS